jgi:hypothetical protein
MFGAQHLLGRLVTVFPLSHKPENHLISHRIGRLPLPGLEWRMKLGELRFEPSSRRLGRVTPQSQPADVGSDNASTGTSQQRRKPSLAGDDTVAYDHFLNPPGLVCANSRICGPNNALLRLSWSQCSPGSGCSGSRTNPRWTHRAGPAWRNPGPQQNANRIPAPRLLHHRPRRVFPLHQDLHSRSGVSP